MSSAAALRARLPSATIVALLAALQLVFGCVEGVTPDCSDAAVCAPSAGDDATSDAEEPSSPTPSETSTTDDAPGDDADGE